MLFGCNTNVANQKNEYTEEDVEWANKFRFKDNVDTINLHHLIAKVSQTTAENEGLCYDTSNDDYMSHEPKMLYFISDEQLWDEKTINEKVCLIGTFYYRSRDSLYRTIPMFCSLDTYKYLLNAGIIEFRKEIQNSDNK